MDKRMRISRTQHLWYVNGSFTCRKILRHGTSGFTSHPKEGVLRIFLALKNPSPRPGLNPRPLGPVASTLITTPPRRLIQITWYINYRFFNAFGKTHETGSKTDRRQDSTIEGTLNLYQPIESDSNPQLQCLSSQRPHIRRHGYET
jgi:hypothetical protein